MADPRPSRPPRKRTARTRSWSAMWRQWLLIPNILPLALIVLAGILSSTAVLVGFFDTPLASPGSVAERTRTVRLDFEVVDDEATARDREDARRRTPRLYSADETAFEEIESSLISLPDALAAADSLDAVAPQIVEDFGLTPERFEAIRALAAEDAAAGWATRISRFIRSLRTTPILTAEEFGLATQATSPDIILRSGNAQQEEVDAGIAISLGAEDALNRLIRRTAGALVGLEADVAASRALATDRPTYLFDREATETLREERAKGVPEVTIRYRRGEPIYLSGSPVDASQLRLAREEVARFRDAQTFPAQIAHIAGALVVSVVLALLLGGYAVRYSADAVRSPLRVGALATIIVGGALFAGIGISAAPALLWFFGLAPVTLGAMIVATAYDRRLGVMVASTLALLAGLALKLPVGYFAVAFAGAVVSAWQMSAVRHRSDVLRGGCIVAIVLIFATAAVSLVSRPSISGVIGEVFIDGLWAGAAGVLSAALTLVILPVVEKVFDITTGMTLSELRDSSHPLLRELQQRAPGTFNHSHTVAIIAEAAAESIGANSMHLYVGAMYHDIGKMNKPEYFVENQSAANRAVHERLSPTMSLLVIVAHVKDGMELAREYALPRSLHHYIESHHGTTLVQYFFHRAKKKAEQESDGKSEGPSEIEYRYPGPKPRTREAAILMLADSVEAATRAMAEPTPSRIGALVREISRKYLTDGQFDDASITLRELTAVEDSITKSLCGIYHGRIAYPKSEARERKQQAAEEPEAKPTSATSA